MNLLTNAVESIQVGVEDWEAGTRPRLLSAVRNVHAGILLLFKEVLRRRSPRGSDDVLVKARTKPVDDPVTSLRFVGIGRKTVDTQQIREHFSSLGIVVDWDQFQQIASVRNDIEHYFADVTHDSLRGVIASAFVIIRAFAAVELEEDPRILLGKATWDVMLEANEVHAAERTACNALLQAVKWESDALEKGVAELRCDECGSDLLRPVGGDRFDDVELECRSCGKKVDSDTFIPAAVDAALDWECYVAAEDGGESPLAECPSCYGDTYVMAEGRCALCGANAEHDCARCGGSIPPSELASSPLCGYCYHMMSKDD